MFGLTALLMGCQTIEKNSPKATAKVSEPLAINARRLEIIDNWQMPGEVPFVGHRAKTQASDLLADWAMRVLQPVGGSGEIIFDISRASVVRTKLPMEEGIGVLFSDQQDSKIRADLDIKIMWLQPVDGSQALIKLDANHSVTIAESASVNDLQNAINEAIMGALASFDQQARAELKKINRIILP
jgi:hypothetical protein